jgi:hypothetical protein
MATRLRTRTTARYLLLLLAFGWPLAGVAAQQVHLQNLIGLGALAGSGTRADSYSFFIEGHNHFKQTKTIWGIRQYGFSQSRLELGNGIGVTLDALSGITLLGLEKDESVAPHLGIEPFDGQITWNSRSSRASYYQWLPMASAGLQAVAGSCRILPELRLGGALGNIGRHKLAPWPHASAGVAAHVNCAQTDFAAYFTRIDPGHTSSDLAAVDIALPLRRGWSFGVRGELVSFHPEQSPGETIRENRMMLVLRSDTFSQ